MKFSLIFSCAVCVVFLMACNQKQEHTPVVKQDLVSEKAKLHSKNESASKIHTILRNITGDFDGDTKQDTAYIVADAASGKHGLKIILSTNKVDYFGMGKEVLNQGFDDLNWAGIFQTAPKGKSYANNVDEHGEIITDSIPAENWITLPNDGIYLHAEESCGGGVIYLDRGKYNWIQQE